MERVKQKYNTAIALKEKEMAAVLHKYDKLLQQIDFDRITQQCWKTEMEQDRIKLQSKIWEQKSSSKEYRQEKDSFGQAKVFYGDRDQ